MAKAKIGVELSPVDTRKIDASLARIQSRAKNLDFSGGAQSINKLSRPLGKITGQATEFQKSLEASNARVLAFGASVAVINKLSQAFGALVSNTIKVEATFAKINTILGGTRKELQQFGNGIFKVAQQTGTSFDQVAEGALELARQGLSVEESLNRVSTSLKLVRVAGIDSQKAVAGLTAAIKGFEGAGLTVTQIADKLAEVDTKFAVSTEDLINGLERASASARVAGVSFDELLGVVTTVQERTQRGGAVIGNAFKTIFARLGRSDTLKTLNDLGISVLDTEGNVRSAIPLFKDLATELGKIGIKSVEAGNIIQKVAGVRQRDILISLVEDLNSGQSQFAKALQVSAGAAGALDSKNQQLNQTLEALINNLTVGSQKLASVLGDLGFSEAAGDILKGLSSVVNKITDVLQGEGTGAKFAQGLIKGIGGILTGPGLALISAVFIKLFVDLTKFGASSLKSLLGINKAAQAQNTLQQSVLQTLLQNEDIQAQLLKHEGNRVVQEQILLRLYNEQALALGRVQKIARTVTPGLFGAGFRGGEGGVTRRSAGGYVAAEARDVSRGVGGATAGSKVVSIPNFAFGGGKRGTMVANSSEYFVPNYAGGGDAIFNQNMVKAMGLPSGARKINAAGGFIPNFATKGTPEYFRNISRKANPTSAEKQELTAFQATKGGNPFNAESRGVVMLVPQTSVRGADINTVFKKPKIGKKGTYNSFIGKAFGIDPNLKADSKFGKLVGLDNELESAMADSINRIISRVYPSIKTSPTPPITAKAAKEKFLQEGGAGAFGSFRGAMFEAIIEMIVGGSNRDGAGTLDVAFNSKNKTALDEIFGLPKSYRFGDYKNSILSKDKFISQAIANRGAGGYIPNFVGGGLEAAISRESAAGVPINQIRVNQSGKLRNAQNPMGLAVTNTRDEPTGAIPNFFQGGVLTTAESVRRTGVAGTIDLTKSEKSVEKFGKGLDNSMTKIFALQFALSGLTNTVEDQDGKLATFGQELSSLVNTLLVLQVMGASPKIPGLGSMKNSKMFGGLASGISLLSKNFMRFIPYVGGAIIAFQGVNALLKTFLGKGALELLGISAGKAADELDRIAAPDGPTSEVAEKRSSIRETRNRLSETRERLAEIAKQRRETPTSLKLAEAIKAQQRQVALAQSLPTGEGRAKAFQLADVMQEEVVRLSQEQSVIETERQNLQEEQVKLNEEIIKQEKFLLKLEKEQITAAEAATRARLVGFQRAAAIEIGAARQAAQRSKQSRLPMTSVQRARFPIQEQQDKNRQEEKKARLQVRTDLVDQVRLQESLSDIELKKLEAIEAQLHEYGSIQEIADAIEGIDSLTVDNLDELVRLANVQNDELDITKDKLEQILKIRKAEATAAAKANVGLAKFSKDTEQKLIDQAENLPNTLATNLEQSLNTTFNNLATGAYDSLGDAFLSIAINFGNELQKQIMQRTAASLTNSLMGDGTGGGKFLNAISNTITGGSAGKTPGNYNRGGLVTGGNGVVDDVPAMLTGGEFVVRKAAVQKYGLENLEKMNSGKYTDQYNFIRDIEPTYAGGMFVPGTRGGGEIVGTQNMLAFAQQETTSGLTDVVSAGRISLEDQSTRLSTRGRFRESPARRALKSAQQQAFGLYQAQIAEDIRERERYEAEQKAREDQFKSAVIGSAINAAMAGAGQFLNKPSVGNLGMTDLAPSSAGGYTPGGSLNPNFTTALPAANGGEMAGATNAMLMGGEYVMSGPAAASIGRSTLEDINAMRIPAMANGGPVGGASSKSKSAAGTDGGFNVTINIDNNGNSDSSSDSQEPEGQKLAKRIKEVVVGVINEEKRVSGSLFMNNK